MASTPYQGVAPQQLSFSSPSSTISGSFISPPDGQTSILFSYKHRGLCLYLARILRFVKIICGFGVRYFAVAMIFPRVLVREFVFFCIAVCGQKGKPLLGWYVGVQSILNKSLFGPPIWAWELYNVPSSLYSRGS